ncbi:MAG TPA: GNAT family N-acetyltransferase [Bryobacteraceae bacterium]
MPMTFADLELARRLERTEATGGASFVEARNRLSPAAGAQWIEIAGAYAMFDGPVSPVTQTFGLGLFAEPTGADLERLESFFLEKGAPVCHEVSPLAGVRISDVLARRGYRPIEFTSVMYRALTTVASPAAAGSNSRLKTRLMVEGEEEVWSQASAHGWGEDSEFTPFVLDLGQVVAFSTGSFCFLAELDGKVVATAVLRCHGGVALLAGASTVPEARKQGAQRALLDARIQMAARQGCDLAMMCAEPGGASQRNAEREGFRIAYTRTKWQLAAK